MGVHMLIVGEAMCLFHFCDTVYSLGFGIERPEDVFSMVAHVLSISKF